MLAFAWIDARAWAFSELHSGKRPIERPAGSGLGQHQACVDTRQAMRRDEAAYELFDRCGARSVGEKELPDDRCVGHGARRARVDREPITAPCQSLAASFCVPQRTSASQSPSQNHSGAVSGDVSPSSHALCATASSMMTRDIRPHMRRSRTQSTRPHDGWKSLREPASPSSSSDDSATAT